MLQGFIETGPIKTGAMIKKLNERKQIVMFPFCSKLKMKNLKMSNQFFCTKYIDGSDEIYKKVYVRRPMSQRSEENNFLQFKYE